MFGFDMNKSIQELEGVEWHGSSFDSDLVARCTSLRQKPLVDFTVEDLRLMIGQRIGLTFLVPIAIDRLSENSYVTGDLYPGDLLVSVLKIEQSWWNSCESWLREQLNDVMNTVENDMQKFGALISQFHSTG